MEVVVYGAGSLGSLVGGILARVHNVTLVGRDPHVSAVRESGLQISGEDSFTVTPDAMTDGTGLQADLALVTVKSYDTEAAARSLARCQLSTVVSLQNGLGNEEVLAKTLDVPVIAGTTTLGARIIEPGHVAWTGRGNITIGPWEGTTEATIDAVVDAFRSARLDVKTTTDSGAIRRHLWEKLAVNAGINPVSGLSQVANGRLTNDPALSTVRAAATETAQVARAHGIDISDDTVRHRVAEVTERTATNRSSMAQDMAEHERTEVDAINGSVVDHAETNDVRVPVNRTLLGLVRTWETGRGLR